LHCGARYLQFRSYTYAQISADYVHMILGFVQHPQDLHAPTQILSAGGYFQSPLMSYTTHINGLLGGVLQYVV